MHYKDYKLYGDDNRFIPVSGVALASHSELVKTMMQETWKLGIKEIHLPAIPHDILKLICNWIDTNELPNRTNQILELAATARFMLMPILFDQLQEALIIVSPIRYREVAEIHFMDKYLKNFKEFLFASVTTVKPNMLLHIFDLQEIVDLLNDDNLMVGEEDLFLYVEKFKAKEKKILMKKVVRYNLLSGEFIRINNIEREDLSDNPNPRVSAELVIAVGGWSDGPDKKISVFAPASKTWTDLTLELPFNWAYQGMVIHENVLYIVGGYTTEHGTSKKHFKLDLNEMNPRFKALSKLNIPRNYVAQAVEGNNILVAGGRTDDSQRVNSVELYNVSENQWYEAPPMNRRRSDAGVANVNGKIFVVGGFDGLNVHDSVEFLDLKKRRWIQVKAMSTKRSGVKAVGLEGKLFVVGGWDGRSRLSTGEVYDGKVWKPLPPMNIPRSNHAMTVVGGHILVAGGYDGTQVTASAEILNLSTNKWDLVGDMTSARSALAMVPINQTKLKVLEKLVQSEAVDAMDVD